MQVLIVDDDIATADVIKNTVDWERFGVTRVFLSYNIEKAKTILQKNAIDIIISDIEMPKGSGLDLLAWYRGRQMEGEFLLLTCHESFDYATNAVKLHAAEYLLKPFDTRIMEAALKKTILNLEEKRIQKENSEYGKWIKKNKRQLQLNFWNMILDGHISLTQDKIKEELKNRKLDEALEGLYHLVISRVTDVEHDRERMNPNLMIFIMENIHSEILCGNPENINVVCNDYKDYYVMVTVCAGKTVEQLEECCKNLIQEFKKMFSAALTCCISRSCKIAEFYEVYHHNLELIASNVAFYGNYFLEDQCTYAGKDVTLFLEFNVMEEMLNDKKKIDFLSYLKKRLNEKVFEKSLSGQMLQQTKQEILQAVYTYLAKRGIQASGLFSDDTLITMTQKASQSVIDMVRWANYFLERTFAYECEIKKSYTIADKINQFIKEHYMENIGRNKIAEHFFLAPEYLAKMYKRQTGMSLKDYINEFRIEQAKILLKNGEIQISDVAEKVGFENFTYFSTIFKKYTGMSPNRFKKL